ncbi:MAG: polysaccharide deacetylase [Mycobacteriales bacterium]
MPSKGRRKSHLVKLGAALAVAAALVASCSQGNKDKAKSGGSSTTVAGSSSAAGTTPGGKSAGGKTTPGGKSSDGTSSAPGKSTSPSGGTSPSEGGQSNNKPPGSKDCTNGNPDTCFTPTKLEAGHKPPQFVVFSFDGVGWHEKWQYFQDIANKVPVRFTGFLTGLYLVDEQHRDGYHPPGHKVGASSLGSFPTKAEVVQEINDLNAAYQRGDEIGTHFNGHFCSDNPPGGNQWTAADWKSELQQFMYFVDNYKKVNGDDSLPDLAFTSKEIQGDRTPCLEGNVNVYYPVLKQFGFKYDSSPDRQGLEWPLKGTTTGIWMMGMPDWWLAGTQHYQIMMDYNMWYSQEQVGTPSPAKSAQDAKVVLQTYKNMYNAAYNGNRAPLIIGNHFNNWNNGAYTEAVGEFMQWVCAKKDTKCVPFRDVVRWMDYQNPSVLKRLQALPPELPQKGRDDQPAA